MGTAALAALLVLLQAFVAVLIVDAAGFGLGEGIVGFGDLNELLRGRFVSTAGLVSAFSVVPRNLPFVILAKWENRGQGRAHGFLSG